MSNKICVYTCITGDYDNLNEIEHPEKNVDYYCFTNSNIIKSKTWKIIKINDKTLDNCRLARKTKILGHSIINNYDICVWTDADVIWQKPITAFIKEYLKDSSLAIFKHHSRNNIHDEAIACLKQRKDDKNTILKTLDLFNKEQFPDKDGLCESTVYIKRPQDPTVKATMELWYSIIKNYSKRDQLSFNYAAWKNHLKFNYINLEVWNNTWFRTVRHIQKGVLDCCHIYFGNPEAEFIFDNYYIFNYKKSGNKYEFTTKVPVDTNTIELNPSNIIGTNCREIVIQPKPNSIYLNGLVKFNENTVCCTGSSTIVLRGCFRKGTKFSFSSSMEIMDKTEIDKLIEYLWAYINLLQHNIEQSQKSANKLQSELYTILNSKGWRMLEKIRKLKPIK